MPGPLAGKTIVVTRPRAQASELVAGIAASGGQSLIFPLLEISPPADPNPLQQAIGRLTDYQIAVFISPNAVEHTLPAILAQGTWPATLRPAAIGPGTVKALAGYGLANCLAPASRFDSEGLLAEAALQETVIASQKIIIFRGNGGRDLLADTLKERGAQVDCITTYQRSGPPGKFDTLLAAWRHGQLDGMVVSSSEALRYLLDGLDNSGRDFLARTPLFIPHPRIADMAIEHGLQRIIRTEAADAGLLAGLRAYNWHA